MATTTSQIAFLRALHEDGNTVNNGISPIPLYEGLNSVGRNDIANSTKQVSRKHVAIAASSDRNFEIAVEGQNAVVIRSGLGRRKLLPNSKASVAVGDVIEFLPGQLPYKLIMEAPPDELQLQRVSASSLTNGVGVGSASVAALASSGDSLSPVPQMLSTAKTTKIQEVENGALMCPEEEDIRRKRKRQLEEDEAFARLLQEEEDRAVTGATGPNASTSHEPHDGVNKYSSKNPRLVSTMEESLGEQYEANCTSSSTFRLMQVKNLPQWANKGCVTIQDVVQGDVRVALLSNYMVDIDWLLGACPLLRSVPSVVVIHGESGGSLELLQASKPRTWTLHKPPLRLSYGTHHSKAMFLVYPTGVRVVVHTANLIYVDWNNKSQGLWMQDFPYKSDACRGDKSPFESDLVEYLQALEWSGCTTVLPHQGEVRINAAFFRRFDYSSATVRLIASVPGYHQGRNLTKWGHMKLRTILQEQCFEQPFKRAPLVYQFSSLGSLDEKWLSELAMSMQAGSTPDKKPLGPGPVQIIWPTVEDIRCSLEGYAAGNVVPSPQKNVERAFLSKYWSHWQADHTGRSRAIPHIKTFVRYNDQSIAWMLLTSSNLSKAAWGTLVKNSSQLMVRSYELGVLFLPSLAGTKSGLVTFSCTNVSSQLLRLRQSSQCLDKEHFGLDAHNDKSKVDFSLEFGRSQQVRTDLDEEAVQRKESKTKLVTLSWKNEHNGEPAAYNIVHLPLPYALPPTKYGPQGATFFHIVRLPLRVKLSPGCWNGTDIPWSWDRTYRQPDVYGEVWPRSVQLYTKQAL